MPTGAPPEPKRWPNTPCALPSCPKLCQTTTKLPSPCPAMAGAYCGFAVDVFTANSPARGAPAASKRRARTPKEDPSGPSLAHATTIWPAGPTVTTGADWFEVVYALTANSPLTAAPAALYTRPNTPYSRPVLAGARPHHGEPPRRVRRHRGAVWLAPVNVLTWNSAPSGAPSARKRWPKMPPWFPSCPSDCQTITKRPAPSTATSGRVWSDGV